MYLAERLSRDVAGKRCRFRHFWHIYADCVRAAGEAASLSRPTGAGIADHAAMRGRA